MSTELLTELTRRGVTLTAAGGRLQVAAPRGALTTELRQQISAQKATLLALLAIAPPASSGQPNRDAGTTPIPNTSRSTELAKVFAPLRAWLERYGHLELAPPEPLPLCAPVVCAPSVWTDPRSDLAGDHGRWTVLLALAWEIDGPDPDGIYGALQGLRGCGAAVVTDVQPLDLTPEGPPLCWRLTRGEIPEPEWQAYRARWLWPRKDVLIKLLQGGAGA
jgi:hypothetical protein